MGRYRSHWLLVLLIFTGVILGNLIGNFLGSTLPILNYGPGPLGLENFRINLDVIAFQITLLFNINVAGLIGLLLAVFIFNRL